MKYFRSASHFSSAHDNNCESKRKRPLTYGDYMKKLIFALVLATSFSASAVDLTLSPVLTAVEVMRSALVTAISPFATVSELSVSAANREVALELQAEALDFLAGEDLSFIARVDALNTDEELNELMGEKSYEEIAEAVLMLSL
jgi:hypothetical protein